MAMLPAQPSGVPSHFPFLPEKLKELGYATHVVGKWHLGFCNWNYTPTYRGFDSFYGFYNGQDDMTTTSILFYFFTERIVDIIEKNPLSLPLFLYLPFQNVHEPLQVLKRFEDMYSNIQNESRRIFLGMVSAMDEGIGNVTMAMKRAGLWDNTLLIFTADNGGWPLFSGNNFSLRGGKITLWEGGTRAAAFVHGSMLQKTGYTSNK
ncbi:PREDICTED: arylsulfatase B-like [Branchiostoma belcheri]|uniref:Arylsulfatase B-like n=1 Tax=Branchiostoma belcheri TaxID=7741 RepID=A0A6P4YG66_BRABE|nr:PREDICTED: arylsulfatase B-like [Branchiostoma belcheri]